MQTHVATVPAAFSFMRSDPTGTLPPRQVTVAGSVLTRDAYSNGRTSLQFVPGRPKSLQRY